MPSLFAVLDEGGRTVLVKTQGDVQTPSFPTLGLLCSISTFASSKGFAVNSYASSNVQIVYQGFPSHLLLVLATSNMLVPRERLKALLQVAYEGLSMSVGTQLLEGNACNSLDDLKRKLLGITWLDHIVNHDALFPCLMLPGPQWFGLSLDDQQQLQLTLTKLNNALSTFTAALLREGLYVAASKQWQQQLPATQQLLIQHIAVHTTHVEGEMTEVELYVTGASGGQEKHKLMMSQLAPGVVLLLLFPEPHVGMSQATITSAVHKLMPAVQPILQVDLWCGHPPAHLVACNCDLLAALSCSCPTNTPSQRVVPGGSAHGGGAAFGGRTAGACGDQGDSRLTLYWCRTQLSTGGHAFNPLASPSLRKQLSSPRSAASASFRSLSISTNMSTADETSALYFKACCDMLAAFMITSSPAPWTTQPDVIQVDGLADIMGSPDQQVSAFKRPGSTLWKEGAPQLSGGGSVEASPRQRGGDDLRITTSVMPSEYTGSPVCASGRGTPEPAKSKPSISKRLLSFISGTPKKEAHNVSKPGHPELPSLPDLPPAFIAAQKPVVHETQALIDGKQLVALMDVFPDGGPPADASLSVFLCSSRAIDRQAASQTAVHAKQALQGML